MSAYVKSALSVQSISGAPFRSSSHITSAGASRATFQGLGGTIGGVS